MDFSNERSYCCQREVSLVSANVSRLLRSGLSGLLSDVGIDSSWVSIGVGRVLPFLLSIVAVLGSIYPVVTVILAHLVHGERISKVQIGGVSVALVGVALVSAG